LNLIGLFDGSSLCSDLVCEPLCGGEWLQVSEDFAVDTEKGFFVFRFAVIDNGRFLKTEELIREHAVAVFASMYFKLPFAKQPRVDCHTYLAVHVLDHFLLQS
jgi:hypothetical protein